MQQTHAMMTMLVAVFPHTYELLLVSFVALL